MSLFAGSAVTALQRPASEQAERLTMSRVLPIRSPGADLLATTEFRDRFKNLVFFTLMVFIACGAFTGLAAMTWGRPSQASQIFSGLSLAMVILSAVVWQLLKAPIKPRYLAALAMGFILSVAAAMATAEVLLTPVAGRERWGVSGIGLWIVVCALICPLGHWRTVLTALSSASMVPLLYGLSQVFDGPRLPFAALLAWMLPTYFCVGIAFLASLMIQRYRRSLAQAQRVLQELGSYRLLRKLGAGGMGEVWLAEHQLLTRQAAVKFIVSDPAQSHDRRQDLTRRLQAEAAIIAHLTCFHTVTVFDSGMTTDGDWYYVMEHLDGIDLQRLVELQGPLSQQRVLRILDRVCCSLGEAHQRGLYHRDIKPGNIMLCRLGGENDVVKVLDFGLAIFAHQAPGKSPTQQLSLAAEGSAGYVAPEVMLGKEQGSVVADLYALGCVAWWLLTGKMIFPDELSIEERCICHCVDDPPDQLRKGSVHPELAGLVYQLIARDPLQRPSSAAAVRRQLAPILQHLSRDEEA